MVSQLGPYPLKVSIEFNKTIDDLLPSQFGAIVTIEHKNGKKYTIRRDFPKGEPEDPLSEKEIEEKFKKWATTITDCERAQKIINCIRYLDDKGSFNELIGLVADF